MPEFILQTGNIIVALVLWNMALTAAVVYLLVFKK